MAFESLTDRIAKGEGESVAEKTRQRYRVCILYTHTSASGRGSRRFLFVWAKSLAQAKNIVRVRHFGGRSYASLAVDEGIYFDDIMSSKL